MEPPPPSHSWGHRPIKEAQCFRGQSSYENETQRGRLLDNLLFEVMEGRIGRWAGGCICKFMVRARVCTRT